LDEKLKLLTAEKLNVNVCFIDERKLMVRGLFRALQEEAKSETEPMHLRIFCPRRV